MNNQKTRATLLGVVAAYLLYTAYQLYEGRTNPDTTMTPFVMILFIVLFVLAAAGLLIYAWKTWKQADKEEKENPSPDDPNSLK